MQPLTIKIDFGNTLNLRFKHTARLRFINRNDISQTKSKIMNFYTFYKRSYQPILRYQPIVSFVFETNYNDMFVIRVYCDF